ncbi:serine/threonine protein kinase [Trichothermofontia sp.]
MELPLSAGICLRQRYLIQRLLGQGRCGYTYLVLDQERFGERCILRQFHLPKIEKPERLEEIRIYFQQEVNRLYQLQHPCIPRFWAAFMEAQELFIVQEFIQGFSCRQLLLSRRQQQQAVSETEVRFLLTTLLPCLDLLHQHHLSQGTIAPDTLVLKVPVSGDLASEPEAAIPNFQTVTDITRTQPLLVNFGSFSAGLLQRLSASDRAANDLDIRHLRQTLLPIGRLGFMPPEQVHAIQVHPHSDLYALAATCLVLLTGQDPEQLFNQTTLTWHWPRDLISPTLSTLLRRMLAWQPVDRYQSAAAVLADLTASAPVEVNGRPSPPTAPTVSDVPPAAATGRSLVPEVNLLVPKLASGSLPQSPAPALAETPPTPLPTLVTPQALEESVTLIYKPIAPGSRWQMPTGRSLRQHLRPYLRPGLILGLSLIGVVSLAWTSYNLLRSRRVATGDGRSLPAAVLSPTPSPAWSSSPSDLRANSPTPAPIPTNQLPLTEAVPLESTQGGLARALRFAPGEVSTLVRGNLEQASSQQYVLEALQGQVLAIQVVGAGAVMNLLRSNGQAIDAAAYRTQRWTGELPADDRYQIEVSGYGAYTLEMTLSPAASQLTGSQTSWIRFAPGETATTVTGEVAPGQVQRYILTANAQQLMSIQVLLGDVEVRTIAPAGQRLGAILPDRRDADATHTKTWQTRLPQAGDYMIEVTATQASRFALKFEIY